MLRDILAARAELEAEAEREQPTRPHPTPCVCARCAEWDRNAVRGTVPR
jgi:hypothetical protein